MQAHTSTAELIETLPDPETDVEAEALDRVLIEQATRALTGLPELERQAVIWSFGLNGVGELSLREIGLRLGCSTRQALNVKRRGLARLRHRLGVEPLREPTENE